jgi:progesterone-induced-blocking factor 1
VDKYMDRVLNATDDTKTKFEQQYSQEIQDLKDRYTKDLELVKQNLVDVYETKTMHLTERRDELEIRNHKLEKQLGDRSKAYEELLFEFRQLQKTTDEEIGLLRVSTRAKEEEIVRVSHLYEENMILVKETKMESEALRQKIDVLKTEYYKLESKLREGSADIKAELAVTKERLANYEMIEKELDQAIMNIAQSDSVIDEDGTNTIGNALVQTITSAPTTSKRRIQ